MAEVNKGVIFSIGQNTFVGFSLKPTKALPVGEGYRAEVAFDGKALGSFPFVIAPPKGSLPSKVLSKVLARGVDDKNAPVGETREFTTLEKVVLAGRGDLGDGTWLEATWIVSGKVDPAGTKSFTLEENKKDVPFFFSFIPEGGWPAGAHEVALVMNGKEIAREKFSVKAGTAMKAATIAVTNTVFHRDDGKEGPGEETKSFGTDDRMFHVEFQLASPVLVKGSRVAWILVETADAKNEEIAVATIEDEGTQKVLTSLLRTKKGLPTGTYRVELRQGDAVLAKQDFEVKTPSGGAPAGGGLKPKN